MIKAEVITHEGNPGPNWLDHCKPLVTPWTISVVVVAIALLFVFTATKHQRDVGQANQLPSSQQSTANALNPLQVQPLGNAQAVQPTGDTNVQALPGASASALPSTASANALGARATPGLNNAKNPNASQNNGNGTADPTQLSAKKLTQNVQSMVTGANGTFSL